MHLVINFNLSLKATSFSNRFHPTQRLNGYFRDGTAKFDTINNISSTLCDLGLDAVALRILLVKRAVSWLGNQQCLRRIFLKVNVSCFPAVMVLEEESLKVSVTLLRQNSSREALMVLGGFISGSRDGIGGWFITGSRDGIGA